MANTINRRDFITFRRAEKKSVIAKKTQRYEQRQQLNIAPPNSGLEPYTGAWDKSAVVHLLKRTMFGAKITDIQSFLALGLDAAVNQLMTIPSDSPEPVNDYAEDDPDVPFGDSWIPAPYNNSLEGYRTTSLRCWWLKNMINQTPSIFEKMVFFWHNHIPIEFNAIFNGRYSYQYLKTIRQHSLGNFKELVKAITIDPAMLFYLNGAYNVVGAPDENYGRELQELFCVGKGIDSNYTEEDVQAAARVLTGWRSQYDFPVSYFEPTAHDTNDKQFSAFYNNTIITGKTGEEGATELDEMLTMIFDNNEVSRHVCRKLYRFFVYHSIDENTELNVIIPLAQLFKDSNYDIIPVLKTLLTSAHFYDAANKGAIIKNSLDYAIGINREFGLEFPDDIKEGFQLRTQMWYWLIAMLMDIGDPPNVAGWPAWYQSPSYDKYWISTSTYPTRAKHSDLLMNYGYSSDNFLVGIDIVKYIEQFENASDPDELINEALSYLYTVEVSQEVKDYMKSLLLTGQTSGSYWYNAWTTYINNPDDEMAYQTVESRLRSLFQYIMQLEEFQLT